jgi:hypothetical protein
MKFMSPLLEFKINGGEKKLSMSFYKYINNNHILSNFLHYPKTKYVINFTNMYEQIWLIIPSKLSFLEMIYCGA